VNQQYKLRYIRRLTSLKYSHQGVFFKFPHIRLPGMTSLNLAKFFLHKSCIIFLSLLFFFSSYNILRAQTDEEFEILNLYYTEKDLVVISATRHPKSISQVAENITVITKKDIENIHAHTLAEILQRIPGIYIQSNRDFGGHSQLILEDILNSTSRVRIPGMSWCLLMVYHGI